MIYLAFGSSLSSRLGNSKFIIKKGYDELRKYGVRILRKSSFYKSKAFPNPSDPEFFNTVILIESKIHVKKLLELILKIETKLGRVRSNKNAPRTIDIDIIDFHSRNVRLLNKNTNLTVPHESLDKRLFVMGPLKEIQPNWKHPRTGTIIGFLIKKIQIDKDNKITKI